MATYEELYALATDDKLLQQVTHALVEVAYAKLQGTPSPADRKWVSLVMYNPAGEASKALRLLLAQHSDLSVAQLQGSTDGAVQTAVDGIVDELIAAMSGA